MRRLQHVALTNGKLAHHLVEVKRVCGLPLGHSVVGAKCLFVPLHALLHVDQLLGRVGWRDPRSSGAFLGHKLFGSGPLNSPLRRSRTPHFIGQLFFEDGHALRGVLRARRDMIFDMVSWRALVRLNERFETGVIVTLARRQQVLLGAFLFFALV